MSGMRGPAAGIRNQAADNKAKSRPANPPPRTSQSRAGNVSRDDSFRREQTTSQGRRHAPNAELQPRHQEGAHSAPGKRLTKDQKKQPGPSVRYVAVQQLLRIEEEGAYAGLVNGAPSLNPRQKQSKSDHNEEEDDLSDYAEGSANIRDRQQTAAHHRSTALGPQQQRTLRQLVSGVTRWRRQLDYVISHVMARSATELESDIRQVLRLGVFELTHMSLASHAVSDYVDLARQVAGHQGAANLTNRVLRDVVRHMEAGDLPDPKAELASSSGRGGGGGGPQDPQKVVRCLAIAHSHPSWLAKRWIKRFGPEAAEELMTHNNRPPLYTVRVNPLRGIDAKTLCDQLQRDGIDARPSSWLPSDFLEIHSGLQTLLTQGYVARGDCLVQDVSAGLVVAAALAPKPGDSVLDCCAAPGGKTIFAAARMQGKGRITAVDISAARLGAVINAAAAAGVPDGMVRCVPGDLVHLSTQASQHVVTAASSSNLPASTSGSSNVSSSSSNSSNIGHDGRDSTSTSPTSRAPGSNTRTQGSSAPNSNSSLSAPSSQPPLFDRVLVDAPCSGSGVLAKRADLRWRRQAEDMPQLLSTQASLLDAAAGLVRPGGTLVYSTCSIEEDENMRQVEEFLKRHTNFQLDPITPEELRQQGVPAGILTNEGCIATLPHVHRGADGAFAARLQRREA